MRMEAKEGRKKSKGVKKPKSIVVTTSIIHGMGRVFR